ncbi:MFS transporter [Vibrio sonorensis]|uniref:MFS transporter n=1 Tax=Vibrio sonorensis TaxID=1004316 RepID=UPI0008D95397|nr:MFS transporter [Vibrio sonorensis]
MFFSRRFLPYFTTQCLGALNDNLYKNALILMVAYSQTSVMPVSQSLFINLAAALFILPFFLFSAHAGNIADRMDKAVLIRRLKIGEMVIMLAGAVAITTQSYLSMLALLFLMGTQSAYFGSVKYALLPQALKSKELVAGNAWVEMGTFLSILLGTLSAGLIVSLPNSESMAAATLVIIALTGWLSSTLIPSLPAQQSNEPYTSTSSILKQAKSQKGIWLSILGISWFWFVGATYLTQFPNFTKNVLNANPSVVSILLALFSIGIALGSIASKKLSGSRVELGTLPLALLVMSYFGLDMLWSASAIDSHQLNHVMNYLSDTSNYRFMLNLTMIGFGGGLYIVPLYAYLQVQSPKGDRAKMVAANNIVNALFMVISAVVSIVVLNVISLSVTQLFVWVSIMNLVMAYLVYKKTKSSTHRCICHLLAKLMYRVKTKGKDNLPTTGSALVIANHVSFVDAILLMSASPRPIRFVMDKAISETPFLKHLFRHVGVIPICSPKICSDTYKQAFVKIDEALLKQEIVCIFPEGKLTKTGELNEFKPGVMKILNQRPVPVYPVVLKGLWGSFFSRKKKFGFKLPSRFWSKIDIRIGQSMQQPRLDQMQKEVETMLAT